MPVDRCGFTLKPAGFFDRNPTLDVPAPRGAHCHSHGAEVHEFARYAAPSVADEIACCGATRSRCW
nr:hypothetical protein [Amycolatopsis methanolica]